MKSTNRRAESAMTLLRGAVALLGAAVLTASCFMVLPIIQAITSGPSADTLLRAANAALPEPEPEPEPEVEPEPEEEPEEEPEPEVEPEFQTLDLAQLELSLNAGAGAGFGGGAIALDLGGLLGGAGVGGPGDLTVTSPPNAIFRRPPVKDARMTERCPAEVTVVFEVDDEGRVSKPRVSASTDPAFDRAVLAAIAKWRFEAKPTAGDTGHRMKQTFNF